MTDIEIPKLPSSKNKIPMLGHELFPSTDYFTCYIAGRKKSGKTVLLYNILNKCSSKKTKVLMFSATHDNDETYGAIKRMLTKKQVSFEAFDNFIVDGVDLIEEFITNFNNNKDEEDEDGANGQGGGSKYKQQIKELTDEMEKLKNVKPLEGAKILFGGEKPRKELENERAKRLSQIEELIAKAKEREETRKLKRNKKTRSAKYILCFDDLGSDLHKSNISQLIIKHRHYHCNIVLLSQHMNFLNPASKRNMDYLCLFGGFPDKDLEKLHEDVPFTCSYEELLAKYREATKEPYAFLYIDRVKDIFKRNFKDIL